MSKLRFKPKFDKIVELLLYIAHKKKHIDHYVASKLVYLIDREHFNQYGRPVTFGRHLAMPYGPVASNVLDLLKKKKVAFTAASIEELPFETSQLDQIIIMGMPRRPIDHDLFSKSDLKIADKIISEYGDKTFDELHEITSKHFAYQNAWNNRPEHRNSAEISYEDLLEECPEKETYIAEIFPVSEHM